MFDFLFEFSKKRDFKGALLFYFGHLIFGALIFAAVWFLVRLIIPFSPSLFLFLSSLYAATYSALLTYWISKERGWERKGLFYTLIAFITGILFGLLFGLIVPAYLTTRD